MHTVQLKHEMAIFATKSEGSITVPTALRRHTHAVSDSARHSSLNVGSGAGNRNGDWLVVEALIERPSVPVPRRGIKFVMRDGRICQTVIQCITVDD
jgi:hypothetical protein